MFLRSIVLTVFLVLQFWIDSPVAQDFDKVEFTSVKAAEHIYMLKGAGGNIGLFLGEDGTFLIDDQFAPLNQKLLATIKTLSDGKVSDFKNTFLINTHFHPDHTDGNELTGESGAMIIAHDNVRNRLRVEQVVPFFDSRHSALSKSGLPIITFSKDVTFYLNGDSVHVIHMEKAHTDGDAIVHFTKANVIHAGDILFAGMYPFIDLDNGGSVSGVIDAVAKMILLSDDKTKIIPGHGKITDKAGLKRYHDMLSTTYERIKQMVKSRTTLEQIVTAKPTEEFDSDFSGMISGEAFVGLLFRDLTDSSK